MIDYNTRLWLSRMTPQRVGRAVYFIIFTLLELGLTVRFFLAGFYQLRNLPALGGHDILRLWPRNSVLTSSFAPFLSDLDITIMFSDSATPEQIAITFDFLRRFTQVFKIVRECNSYSPNDCLNFSTCLNQFEAHRDPRLRDFVPEHTTSVDAENGEKLAYLFRHIEANLVALAERPELQVKKWRLHLENCDLKLPTILTLPALVDQVLAQLLQEHPSREHFQNLMEYFRQRIAGTPHHLLTSNLTVIAFYPNSFCLLDLSKIKLAPELRAVQLAQLRWETWGLMSQWRQYRWRGPNDQMSFRNHAANLKRSFSDLEYLEKLSQLV